MAQFITTKHNKFENKTTTEGVPCLLSQSKKGKTRWYFKLRHISTPDIDDLVIDVHYLSPDWFFLRNGDMIINIDGVKNITFEPHESYSDVGREQGAFEQDSTVICEENCFYNLTKEELKEICEASHVDIQVTGESEQKQMDGTIFHLYARAYYNSVFDNSLYKGSLSLFQKEYSKWKRIEWWQKKWAWVFVPLDVFLAMILAALIGNGLLAFDVGVGYWEIFFLILGGLILGSYAYVKSLGKK